MQYTFRCILDVDDDVIRDIRINANANLHDLHEATAQAFGLSLGEMAAFYRTNANWDQGEEIPLFDMSDAGTTNEMKDHKLSDIFTLTDDKILYVYDFLSMWTFFIELHKMDKNQHIETPQMIFSTGKLPEKAPDKQFVSENIDDDLEEEFDSEFGDEFDIDEDISNYY